MHLRSTIAAASVACVAAATLTSCSGGSAEELTDFRVGVFSADVTFGAFYSAIGEGGALSKVLDDAGVELSIETIPSGSNLVAALAGGSVDAAIVPGASVLGVDAQGGDLVPLMNMFDGPSQQVIANSASQAANGDDVRAFDGQRWAFTRLGSISEISARLTAENAGLNWSDQEQLPLGSGSETQAVLESGRADILSTSPVNASQAVASGKAYLISNPQADETLPIADQLNSVFTTSTKFAEQHPDFVQQVVTALVGELSGLATTTSAAEALETMSPAFVDAVGDTWELQWDYSITGFARASGGFSPAEIEQTLTGATLVDVVEDGYEPSGNLFDNKYVLAAYDELGVTVPAALS